MTSNVLKRIDILRDYLVLKVLLPIAIPEGVLT